MFPMTMTIHNQAQLAVVLGALGGLPSAALATHAAPVQADQPKDTASPKPKAEKTATSAATAAASGAPGPRTAEADAATAAPEKTAAASNPTAAPAAAQQPASTAAAEPIPYNKVASAITAMVKTDRQRTVDALAKFGAKKGPDLKPEQYADFLAALEG